jgi:sRNA-binding protein
MLHILVKTFPSAFIPSGRSCRPLRVGIFEDLDPVLPPEIDRARLKLCLGLYTGQPSYLRELKPGAIRIGLHGRPAGRVSPKEAASAAARLQKLQSPENGLPAATATASASYRTSAPQISPTPLTARLQTINPRRTPVHTELAVTPLLKKGAQPGQRRVIVVVKRRKMPLESPHHRF